MLDLHEELPPRIFKELVAAGAVTSATVQASAQGYFVVLQVGLTPRTLGAFRGGVRYFPRLDGPVSALRQAGIYEFKVDLRNWTPKRPPEHLYG